MGVDELIDKLTIEVAPNDILVEKLQEMYEASKILGLLYDITLTEGDCCPSDCVGQVLRFEPANKLRYMGYVRNRITGRWQLAYSTCIPFFEGKIHGDCKVQDYFDFKGKPF